MNAMLLHECRFRLDGGAMFGHVPKVVWSRMIETDAENRIQLACKPLLLQHPSGRIALVETGMGTKWNAKERAMYALEVEDFDALLAPHGIARGDVTDVILTHLHLDHAGGATRLAEDGATIVPAFPNARHHVQRGEWEVAQKPDPRSRPSYRPENYEPLHAAGLVDFVDGEAEILPGVRVIPTPGHTRFHQTVRIETGGAPIYYLGDIMPTSRHVRPHYAMGFDLYPLDVMTSRSALLERIVAEQALCIFEHDNDVPVGHIVRDGKELRVEAASH